MEQPPTSSPDDAIDVPDEAQVQCPLAGFDLTPVFACAGCPHFAGLEDRFPGSDLPFGKRYVVRCKGEPVKRVPLMLAKKKG